MPTSSPPPPEGGAALRRALAFGGGVGITKLPLGHHAAAVNSVVFRYERIPCATDYASRWKRGTHGGPPPSILPAVYSSRNQSATVSHDIDDSSTSTGLLPLSRTGGCHNYISLPANPQHSPFASQPPHKALSPVRALPPCGSLRPPCIPLRDSACAENLKQRAYCTDGPPVRPALRSRRIGRRNGPGQRLYSSLVNDRRVS